MTDLVVTLKNGESTRLQNIDFIDRSDPDFFFVIELGTGNRLLEVKKDEVSVIRYEY